MPQNVTSSKPASFAQKFLTGTFSRLPLQPTSLPFIFYPWARASDFITVTTTASSSSWNLDFLHYHFLSKFLVERNLVCRSYITITIALFYSGEVSLESPLPFWLPQNISGIEYLIAVGVVFTLNQKAPKGPPNEEPPKSELRVSVCMFSLRPMKQLFGRQRLLPETSVFST